MTDSVASIGRGKSTSFHDRKFCAQNAGEARGKLRLGTHTHPAEQAQVLCLDVEPNLTRNRVGELRHRRAQIEPSFVRDLR